MGSFVCFELMVSWQRCGGYSFFVARHRISSLQVRQKSGISSVFPRCCRYPKWWMHPEILGTGFSDCSVIVGCSGCVRGSSCARVGSAVVDGFNDNSFDILPFHTRGTLKMKFFILLSCSEMMPRGILNRKVPTQINTIVVIAPTRFVGLT